jgi:hypothetical protein
MNRPYPETFVISVPFLVSYVCTGMTEAGRDLIARRARI